MKIYDVLKNPFWKAWKSVFCVLILVNFLAPGSVSAFRIRIRIHADANPGPGPKPCLKVKATSGTAWDWRSGSTHYSGLYFDAGICIIRAFNAIAKIMKRTLKRLKCKRYSRRIEGGERQMRRRFKYKNYQCPWISKWNKMSENIPVPSFHS